MAEGEALRRLISVHLVPVEVFGSDEGYGLSDAVPEWSDCNRAIGHIYRFDDLGHRRPGETLEVWVDPEEYRAFAEREWGESP